MFSNPTTRAPFLLVGAAGSAIAGIDLIGTRNDFIRQIIRNTSADANALAWLSIRNDSDSGAHLFINSSTRAIDGGVNTATLRNDIGALRLQSQGANGIFISATTGNVQLPQLSIGTAAANAALQLGNVIANRRIMLWDAANNDHQFLGFGINNNTLRYQVAFAIDSHVFFAGASTTTSRELARIAGTGLSTFSGADMTVGIEVADVMRWMRPGVSGVRNSTSFGIAVGSWEAGINGAGRADFKVSGAPAAGNSFGNVPDVTVMSLLSNGHVGLGTTAPPNRFTVLGGAADTTRANVKIEHTGVAAAWGCYLKLRGTSGDGVGLPPMAQIL
jgi:hypothetical protein